MSLSNFSVGNRLIGNGAPCFIVAEVATNHNRNLKTAKELICVAAEAGVDAIKFQTYHWQDIVHADITGDAYGSSFSGPWRKLIEERLALPREWYPELFAEARARGLIPFSTPHCEDCTEFLLSLGVPLLKVASMEVNNTPFLERLGALGKPVMLSTGMAELWEVDLAVRALRKGGCREIVLMHCVSNYPASPGELNLRQIPVLREAFGLPVGFSDHSMGVAASIAAVALGACVIEKHITLDRRGEGPDHFFALEPEELRRLVRETRDVEAALGTGVRELSQRERENRSLCRKSLVAAREIPPGSRLQRSDILITRPGTGLPPYLLDAVVGLTVHQRIGKHEPITWEKFREDYM